MDIMRGEGLERFNGLEAGIGEIVRINEAGANRASADSDTRYASSRARIIGLLVGGVALGLAPALWLARLVSRPLQQAVAIAQTVADGDLGSRIEVNSRDETGQLQALKQMNESRCASSASAQRHRVDRQRVGGDRHRQPTCLRAPKSRQVRWKRRRRRWSS